MSPREQFALAALAPADRHVGCYVRILRHLEQRFEAGQHLARQGAGQLRQQIVTKASTLDGVRVRQLGLVYSGHDVQVDVLPVLSDPRALNALRLSASDPFLCGFGDGDAFARRGVDALAHVDLDLGCSSVGVFLELISLNVTVAVLIGVIDDPGFLFLALRGCPSAFANAHSYIVRQWRSAA